MLSDVAVAFHDLATVASRRDGQVVRWMTIVKLMQSAIRLYYTTLRIHEYIYTDRTKHDLAKRSRLIMTQVREATVARVGLEKHRTKSI